MAAVVALPHGLDTDNLQLGYAREPRSLLATRTPKARWAEDLGEGALANMEEEGSVVRIRRG